MSKSQEGHMVHTQKSLYFYVLATGNQNKKHKSTYNYSKNKILRYNSNKTVYIYIYDLLYSENYKIL